MAYVPRALRSKGGSAYTPVGLRRSRPGQTGTEAELVRKHVAGGVMSRLASDLRDVTLGTPGFVYGTGKAAVHDVEELTARTGRAFGRSEQWGRPRRKRPFKSDDIVKAIAQSYAYTYGPALPFTKGGVGTTAGRMWEHPLFSALDVAALASGGTAAGVRAGLLRSAPRTMGLKTPSGETVTRPVVGTELSRRLRVGAQEAQSRLLGNETKRAAKWQRRGLERQNLSREARLEPYLAAVDRLPAKQKVALSLRAEYVTKANVMREVERLRGLGERKQAKLYSDPKVLEWVEQPTKRMQRVLDMEDRWVTPFREEVFARTRKNRKGEVTPLVGEAAKEQRRWLPLLLQRGARYLDSLETPALKARRAEVAALERRIERQLEFVRKQRFTSAERKAMGEVGPDSSDLVIQLREQIRPLEAEIRTIVKDWNSNVTDLLLQRRELNRLLKLGEDASNLARVFAERAGVDGSAIHGMETIGAQVEALTGAIRAIRGKFPAEAEQLQKQVGQLRKSLRQAEKPRTVVTESSLGVKAVTPSGRVIQPRGSSRLSQLYSALGIAKERVARAERTLATRRKVSVEDVRAGWQGGLRAPESQTIAEMIAEIKAELPPGAEPRYRPQKIASERGAKGYGAGGSVEPRSPIRQNKAQLWAAGKIARSIDTLGPNTQRLLRYALYTDKHSKLGRGAKPFAGEVVDGKQWTYYKRHRNERIGTIEKNRAGFEAELDRLVDLEDPGVSKLGEELTTLDPVEAAVDAAGNRLVVPVSYAKKIVGEFTRNNEWYAKLYRSTTDVWRALVLNLRVGWLVNNIAGNTFLYAIKSAGIGGLRAYWNEVLRTNGKAAAHRMISDPALRRDFSPEFWAEHFGDQVLGTFYGTQTPEAGRVARLLGHRRSPTRVLRSLDVGYEKRVRKALLSVYMKRNPAVRQFYKEMPKQARSWEAAARKSFADEPVLAERISQQVNDGLGDYLHMSDFERKALRGAAPFYGWYQAITKIVVKMPLDSPYRTVVLANMGRVGMEWSEDYGLPWLEGAVPLDDDGLVFGSQAMNPYSTPYALGRGIVASDWYGSKQREGILNPLIPLGFKTVFGEGSLEGRAREQAKVLGLGLPFSRLAFPQERKSYSTDPRLRELLGYLGVPIKRVNR